MKIVFVCLFLTLASVLHAADLSEKQQQAMKEFKTLGDRMIATAKEVHDILEKEEGLSSAETVAAVKTARKANELASLLTETIGMQNRKHSEDEASALKEKVKKAEGEFKEAEEAYEKAEQERDRNPVYAATVEKRKDLQKKLEEERKKFKEAAEAMGIIKVEKI